MKFEARRFSRRARGKCETIVVFGAVQARNAGHWSLFDKCRREMRDCRRFLSRASVNRETVVVFMSRARPKCETFVVFGVVQARIAGHWSLFDKCRPEMRLSSFLSRASAKTRDCRRFYESRARAKCETFVVFGVVQARSARLSSFFQGYSRDPRNVGGFLSSQ